MSIVECFLLIAPEVTATKKVAVFMLTAALVSCSLLEARTAAQTALAPRSDDGRELRCDFSSYKPLNEPHSLLKGVVKKVEPKYPTTASGVGASGKVVVRILINKKGDVVNACAAEGHPLLRSAAVQAAMQWKFANNFGFSSSKLRRRFAVTSLTFDFHRP